MGVVREHVRQALEGTSFKMMKGPIFVIAHFRFPITQALPKYKRDPMHNYPHTNRPDGDNLEKFLNDALNGLVWDDDCKIAWLFRTKSKTKARVGETILFVREFPEGAPDYDQIFMDLKEHLVIEDIMDS